MQLIEPTDTIDVSCVPVLIYGGPGTGKTSLAQTANEPLTLDFDTGIHRSFNRKRAMRFDSWDDMIRTQEKGDFKPYKTLVLDTLGALLDVLAAAVKSEAAGNAQRGGLSIQGWGVLGNRFGQWVRQVVRGGQDIVMVCHEEEEKDVNGVRFLRPSMPGKMAYTAVHRLLDLMGHIQHEGGNRFLQFNPTETAIAKNAAGWDLLPVPRLETKPTFLADLLADAKTRIGKTAEASAAVAAAVAEWQAKLAADPIIDDLNALAKEAIALPNGLGIQVRALIKTHAKKAELVWDNKAKLFIHAEEAGTP